MILYCLMSTPASLYCQRQQGFPLKCTIFSNMNPISFFRNLSRTAFILCKRWLGCRFVEISGWWHNFIQSEIYHHTGREVLIQGLLYPCNMAFMFVSCTTSSLSSTTFFKFFKHTVKTVKTTIYHP